MKSWLCFVFLHGVGVAGDLISDGFMLCSRERLGLLGIYRVFSREVWVGGDLISWWILHAGWGFLVYWLSVVGASVILGAASGLG